MDVSFDLILEPLREHFEVAFELFVGFLAGCAELVLGCVDGLSAISLWGGVDWAERARLPGRAGERRGESVSVKMSMAIAERVKSESEDSRIDASSVKTESEREESSLPFRIRPFLKKQFVLNAVKESFIGGIFNEPLVAG